MSLDYLQLQWNPPPTVHPSDLHTPLPPGYILQDPTPAHTTRTPGELLAELYTGRHKERDWTEPSVLQRQLDVHLNHPANVGAPIGSTGLVGRWPRPNGLAAVPVPSGVSLPKSNGRQFEVEFRHVDRERPSTGIPVVDLYTANPDPLEGANDFILGGFWKGNMTLIIAWPGYELQRFAIPSVTTDGTPLTRCELGEKITRAYAVFFNKVEAERVAPKEVGFFNIALHQGLRAKSDSLGVQLTQVHLVRFRGSIGGYWITDVEIV